MKESIDSKINVINSQEITISNLVEINLSLEYKLKKQKENIRLLEERIEKIKN